MAYLFLYICLEAGAFGDTNEPEYAYESNEMKGSNPCLRGTFTLFRLPQEEALRALCRHYNQRKNVVQHNHILAHAALWAPRRRPSYAQQYNYILNVGTYVRASASEGQSMSCPVPKGTRAVEVFHPIAIKP